MTFGYVGYVWVLLGCSMLLVFTVGIAAVLYAFGRRFDRQRGIVTEVTRESGDEPQRSEPS